MESLYYLVFIKFTLSYDFTPFVFLNLHLQIVNPNQNRHI